MTKVQTAKLNMFIAMGLFFVKYEAMFTTFLQLVNEITGFTDTYNDLQLEIAKQKLKISGVVTDKDTLLDDAIALLVKSARKARAWAVNTGNSTLAAQFDVQVSTFEHMTQSVVLNALTTINAALNTNMTALLPYRVTAANVTAITAAIASATTSIGTPKQAITTRAIATSQIELDIATCDGYLELVDDLLVPEYEESEPDMVAAYHLSRAMASLGTNATGLKATNADALTGALLQDVLVTIVEVSRSALSNIDGVALIERMKPGKYHVTCTKVGYVDFATIIEFKLGKIQALAVKMVAV